MQREEHFAERAKRVRLHPAERTQPDRGETDLKLANVNLPYGPVPDQVEQVIDHLAAVGRITKSQVQGLGRNAQLLKPGRQPESDALTDDEKQVIDWVLATYGDLSPTKISELSHREKAYASTRPGEQIAYEYAKFLENLP